MIVESLGESALMVKATKYDRETAWGTVHALAENLYADPPPGFEDATPTFDTVVVHYDCSVTSGEILERHILRTAAVVKNGEGTGKPQAVFRIPVVYGGRYGPDLEHVAKLLSVSEEEFVKRHSEAFWTVRFLGGPVGAPIMTGSPFVQGVRRRRSPRTRVPAGSIAVAGSECLIYIVEAPAGWQIIGRTPMQLANFDRSPHVSYVPGDRFQFVPWHAGQQLEDRAP